MAMALTTESVKTLIRALIASRLDYCNSVFYQISAAIYKLCRHWVVIVFVYCRQAIPGHLQGRSISRGSHPERSKASCQWPQLVEETRRSVSMAAEFVDWLRWSDMIEDPVAVIQSTCNERLNCACAVLTTWQFILYIGTNCMEQFACTYS